MMQEILEKGLSRQLGEAMVEIVVGTYYAGALAVHAAMGNAKKPEAVVQEEPSRGLFRQIFQEQNLIS